MRRYVLIFAAGIAAVAALVLLPPVTRSAADEKTLEERVAALEQQIAARPAMAVVDVEALVNGYKKTADMKAAIKKFVEEEQGKLDAMKDAVAKMKEMQDKYQRESGDWWDYEGKISAKERQMELRARQVDEQVKAMQMKGLEDVYKDVLAAVRKCAAEKGIDLVYWKHGDIDEETWKIAREEGNPMAQTYMIDIRPILYASDKVMDITEDVKKALPAE